MGSAEIPNAVRIAVHVAPDASPEDIEDLRLALEAVPGVASVSFRSKEEYFERFKVTFRDHPDIVANTKPWMLPQSFLVQLVNTDIDQVRLALRGRPAFLWASRRDRRAPDPES
jgi:cell division protein FtsX